MLLCGIAVSGCGLDETLIGPRGPFAVLDLPETPAPEGAAWPRLADVPDMPPPGVVGPGAPDPATGRQVAEQLKVEAAVSSARAEALGGPVLTPAEQARLRGAGREAAAARSATN